MDHHDADDDTPFADPQIRADYGSAFGRFLIEFNNLDNELAVLIVSTITSAGRNDLAKKYSESWFQGKIGCLELLSVFDDSTPHLSHPAAERNGIEAKPDSSQAFRSKSI